MLNLDEWQKEILRTKGNIVLCSGRQTGKSVITSILAAEYARDNDDSSIIIVSITEDQAELMIMKILNYLEENYKSEIAKGKKKPLKHQITLKNGSVIRCRPVGNTGAAIRGFTGNMLIADEAAFMPEDVWAAAKPTLLTTAGRIILVSTPHGKQGYFYECYTNKNNRFKVFHVTSEDVIRNRLISNTWTETQRAEAIRFLEEEKADMSDLQFGQEYMGKFLDDLKQFFSDDWIMKVCTAQRTPCDRDSTYVMGCDLARLGGDASTFEIFKKLGDNRVIQVENISKKGLRTMQNENQILDLISIWNISKVGIDAGSGTLGVSIYDHLQPKLRNKLVAMNNRRVALDREGKKTQRIFKEDMYDNLLSMGDRKEIELLNDAELKLSLKSIQWELAKDKQSVHIFANPHELSDITEGIVRGAWLAKEKNLNIWMSYF
jgi:hypothetical protein